MGKDNFLDIIMGTSKEDLLEFIRKNGKEPKLICPVVFASETRYIVENVGKEENNNESIKNNCN